MYGQAPASNQFGQPYGSYGAAQNYGDFNPYEASKPSPFARRPRQTNLASIVVSWFLPVVVFSLVFALQSFSMHYDDPKGCKTLCMIILICVIALGLFAGLAWRNKLIGAPTTDPLWVTFQFLTCLAAWIFAMVFGNKNFVQNLSPYKDIMNLNIYQSVNPGDYRGQQLMDAGRIEFVPGSHLDLTYSMGFRNLDTYCVAPISIGNGTAGPLATYDFWAVGLNCCSGHAPDFHCGEYNNPAALSGLRLMRDDLRAYFRLAVQQAEAAYNIHAQHPIFLYWMQDPANEITAYQNAAYKYWLVASLIFVGAQLVLVILAVILFSKIAI